jgi:CRP/FNR family transcriptional regulator, anaerobic regulatory protein
MEGAAAVKSAIQLKSVTVRPARPVLRDVSCTKTLCSMCGLQHLCLPLGLDAQAMRTFDQLVTTRIRLHKGDTLFRPGDRFTALYAIRSGSCKTLLLTEDGREQVSGYYMRGEIIGTDGISTDRHDCQAIVLEDTEVCVLPFDRLEEMARSNGGFQHTLHRLLGSELARERNVMLMLGNMRAEQRLASFLLDLSRRYQDRGYSTTEFVLRMTREEIGSYLGLKLETVSRVFSRFHQEGLLQVEGRIIKLLDRTALKQLVDSNLQ